MEIIVVLGLIVLIAGLVVTNLDKLLGGGNEKVAKIWLQQVKTPLLAYRIDLGSYPSTDEGLKALTQAPAGKEKRWKGPYLEKLDNDPWQNPYQYRYPGVKNPGSYDVWSWGPDGVESADDIGNWE